jgi:hypothetical protein
VLLKYCNKAAILIARATVSCSDQSLSVILPHLVSAAAAVLQCVVVHVCKREQALISDGSYSSSSACSLCSYYNYTAAAVNSSAAAAASANRQYEQQH